MKKNKTRRKIQYTLCALLSLIFLGLDCEKGPESELFKNFEIEYRYYWESPSINYDCFPLGGNALYDAYTKANVVPYIHEKDTLYPPNTYNPIMESLFVDIQRNYSYEKPWYIEGGLMPEQGYNYPPNGCQQGDPCADSVCGLTFIPENGPYPYRTFSLVFVGTIRDFYDIANHDIAVGMVAIHELGHQYGHLSDKYLNPEDHNYDCCCVMDQLDASGGYVIECEQFCPKCIDSLKKVNWSY